MTMSLHWEPHETEATLLPPELKRVLEAAGFNFPAPMDWDDHERFLDGLIACEIEGAVALKKALRIHDQLTLTLR